MGLNHMFFGTRGIAWDWETRMNFGTGPLLGIVEEDTVLIKNTTQSHDIFWTSRPGNIPHHTLLTST